MGNKREKGGERRKEGETMEEDVLDLGEKGRQVDEKKKI